MVPWKHCDTHDSTYLYGRACPFCLTQGEAHVARRLICDQDSILADLSKDWYGTYNKLHDDDLTVERVKAWETHKFAKAGTKIYDVLHTPGLYRNLEPLPGAVEALTAIYDAEDKFGKRFEVYVVSASESDIAFAEKKQWLHEHFPFLAKRRIGFFHEKQLIDCDVFIDDSPHNIRAMRAAQPLTEILTIAYPYNEDVRNITNLHAESWRDPASAWKQILDYLKV